MKIIVQARQNPYDIAMQYYGSHDGVKQLMLDNPDVITGLTDAIPEGTVLNVLGAPINDVIVRQYAANGTVPANDDDYSQRNWTNYSTATGDLNNDDVQDVLEAANGDIWIAVGLDGVYRVSNGVWSHFTTVEGLISNKAKCLHQDSATGDIWIGTLMGLSVYNGSTFTNYTTANGLVDNDINWIGEALGDTWLITQGGVSRGAIGSWSNYTGASAELPSSICFSGYGSADEIWIGTNSGLVHWDATAATLYDVAGGELPNDGVVALHKYNGILYVGLDDDGTVIYDGANWITHDTAGPNALSDSCLSFATDAFGITYGGFAVNGFGIISKLIRRGKWVDEANSNTTGTLPDDSVQALIIDRHDNFWIGTIANGLYHLNRNPLINA